MKRPLLFAASWLPLTALLALAILGRFSTRDPGPYFEARHGRLESAKLQRESVEQGYLLQERLLTSTSGLRFEMEIKAPTGPGRRPLVLLLGGHRTGKKAIHLVPDTHGAVLAALSYPYHGEHKLKGWAILAAVPGIRRALMDTPPALSLAIDHLESQPFVDPRRIELVGVSLGAPLACVAGAIDPRFRRVWAIHGGGQPGRMVAHNVRHRLGFPLRSAVAALAGALTAPLAPERFVARIAPRPFIMLNAEDDERIPRASVHALFEAARMPKELEWAPGGHLHPKRLDIVQQLVERVLKRLAP